MKRTACVSMSLAVAFSAAGAGTTLAQATSAQRNGSSAPAPNGHQVVTLTDTLPGGVGGVAVDRAGMIYVADFANTVWRVTPAGKVEVFATGLYGASGNAIDSQGRLIQSNFYNHTVSRISRTGDVSTLATGFNGPVGIAMGPDDHMVVTNCSGNTLSKVTPDGVVTPFAESPLFACPNGVTRAPDGTHFVVNFSDTSVLSVAEDGTVEEFAKLPGGGNGHITFARGSLWATSFRGNRVYQIGLDGTVTLAGGTGVPGRGDGPALEATFTLPNGIATNAQQNRLYINDYLVRPQGTELVPPAPRSILRQIKLASFSDRLAAALTTGGIAAMTETYRAWKGSPSGGGFTELEVNGFGYALLSAGNLQAARRAFELNTESYPQSWNAWDSLGEALKALGETEESIAMYEKSLELNPGNQNARAMLEELRGGS